MRIRGGFVAGLALVAMLLAPVAAPAAEWEQMLVVYGWFTWQDGDATFGRAEVDVDVDVSELLNSLEMSGMVRYRAQSERWAFGRA